MLRAIVALKRELVRGLRALVNRRATDADVNDEVRDYLERATSALVARGVSPEAARRVARTEIGNVTVASEQVRSYGWENRVDTFVADIRYAARRLRANSALTITVVLTLALGIGAATTIFSAVNPILIAALPYRHPDRLAMIWEARTDGNRNDGTFGMYREIAARGRSFDAVAAFKPWQPTLTGRDRPEQFTGQRVSASYFRVFEITPALGRDFDDSDDRPSAPSVVILSDALWRRRFGADPAILGRQVTLDDNSATVIGVLPPRVENVLAPSADLWSPLQYDMSQGRAWGHHLRLVARLRPSVSLERATRELATLGRAVLREQRPATYGSDVALIAVSLQSEIGRDAKPALLALLAAVALVLVIACINVTNLLMADGVRRRSELALRSALGATHGRLTRQLLTENLLIAALGGSLSILVAVVGIRALVALGASRLPRADSIRLDGHVLAFGFVATTFIGVVLGLVLARGGAGDNPRDALAGASQRTTGRATRARGALVIAEVSFALVLLVSSGLLVRSIQRLLAIDPGFTPSHTAAMQLRTSGQRFADAQAAQQYFERLLATVRSVPGVADAALTSQLPLSGDLDEYGVHFESRPETEGYNARRYAVSSAYVDVMHIALRRGRSFDVADRPGSTRVALINESLAKRALGGVEPIGTRIRVGGATGAPFTVVGVVSDVRQASLALDPPDAVYIPAVQWPQPEIAMWVVVKTRASIESLAPSLRGAVWSVDKDQLVARITTMDELVSASAAERRFALVVFAAFAAAALILAAAGIYGVLAGSVAERTREIGVRSALGASRASIRGLVVRQGMRLALTGSAFGLAIALGTSRVMASLLFAVSPADGATYATVTAILLAVATLACWIPAWRASRVDPAITLRADG